MAKNIIYDVVPKERKSIRQIPLPERKRGAGLVRKASRAAKQAESEMGDRYRDTDSDLDDGTVEKRGGKKWILWTITGLCVLFFILSISSFFSGATVIVEPKNEPAFFNVNLTAKKGDSAAKLSYEVLPLEKSASEVVEADGETSVSRKASGTIVIYNNFSDSPQRLIKNTRFETQNGLIFRIADSITIPGRTKKDGVSVPGSIETPVYADAAGEGYNIGLSDFTIPGFKSDAERYEKIYARSKTPLEGGFVGIERTVTESRLAEIRQKLRVKLESEIAQEAVSQIPDGFTTWSGASSVKFESLPNAAAEGNGVTVSEKVSYQAMIFDANAVTKLLMEKAVPDYDGSAVEIRGLEKLSFERSSSGPLVFSDTIPVPFMLKGEAVVVWKFDESKLRRDLAGKSKRQTKDVLASYKNIEKTKVVLRPFWKGSFPNKPSRIRIEENLSL